MEIYSLQMNRHMWSYMPKDLKKKKNHKPLFHFLQGNIFYGLWIFTESQSYTICDKQTRTQKLILHNYKFFRTNTETSTGFCILVSHPVPNNNSNHKILCAGYCWLSTPKYEMAQSIFLNNCYKSQSGSYHCQVLSLLFLVFERV